MEYFSITSFTREISRIDLIGILLGHSIAAPIAVGSGAAGVEIDGAAGPDVVSPSSLLLLLRFLRRGGIARRALSIWLRLQS